MTRITVILMALIMLSGCSVLQPKFVGHEYKEYEREVGCNWHTEYAPSFEFEIVSRGNSRVLKIFSGRHKTQGTGHIKYRQTYEKYQKSLAYPPRYYKKYIGEEVIEEEDGYCRKVRVPGGSQEIQVRLSPPGMRGSKLPNQNGEIAIHLMEPAILAGKDRTIKVSASAVVDYKMPGDQREKRKRISESFEIPNYIVNELLSNFHEIETGSIQPDSKESALALKYAYDKYGELKWSAEFIAKVEEARVESKSRGIPLRKTNAARGLLRLARINPIGLIAGFFLDLALSGDSVDAGITFVEP